MPTPHSLLETLPETMVDLEVKAGVSSGVVAYLQAESRTEAHHAVHHGTVTQKKSSFHLRISDIEADIVVGRDRPVRGV